MGSRQQDHREESQDVIKEEWERLEARKKRDKERETEVEIREKAVGDREKWVVEEMR